MLTRRAVLLGSAAAALVGCTPRRSPTSHDPDRTLTSRVAVAERELLARYEAAVARHPGLSARLGPLREAHAAHLAALGPPSAATPSAGPAPASPTPGTQAAASSTRGTQAPASAAGALAWLAAAERAAASARVLDCVAARSGDLARLLAAIGASEAAHVLTLRR